MAIPVARVHLAVAHAALPALLPSPPKWKMLPLLPTPPCLCPCPCVAAAAILPKIPKPLAKPSRADSNERWDACKTKPASAKPSASSSSSGHRSADSVRRSSAGHGSSPRKNATSPPPKADRADSVERWDAHKKSSSSSLSPSSGSGTSSLVSSSKWSISRTTSAERWDVHKERRPLQADADHQRLDDDESSRTGSGNDIDTEEEILWKPRAMYVGLGFVVAAPESNVLPIPTALFLVPVA